MKIKHQLIYNNKHTLIEKNPFLYEIYLKTNKKNSLI